jgi:exonuclease SbcC
MIPVRLRLRGFLSYQEPVELDFTTFDLACISGANGAGKSSLLDAMTWALFGQARRRDDSLINSHAETAEVVFDFRYEGNLYRVQRAKPRDKSTLLEFFICAEDGVWRPLTERSMRETEARIQATLRMDFDTFINASFLLQDRADQFAQQRPGDRKRVLSAILGLEVWEEYRQAAYDRRRGIEGEIHSIDAQLEDIEAELAQGPARKARLAEVEASLENLNRVRAAGESELASLKRRVAVLEETRRIMEMLGKTAAVTRGRFERLTADLESLREEQDGYRRMLAGEGEVRAAHGRWQAMRAELARMDETAANFREVEARRAGPRDEIGAQASVLDAEKRVLFAHALVVQQDQAQLPELDRQIDDAAAGVRRLEERLAGRAPLEAALQETQASASDSRSENGTLRRAMQDLKERIERLHHVEGAACPLCGQPLSPEERAALVAGLEQEGKEMGNRYRANLDLQTQSEARVRELQAEIAGLARFETELREQTRQHDRLEAGRQRIVEAVAAWTVGGAARLAEIDRVLREEDFAHEARSALAVIDAESKALGYDAAAHDALRKAEVDARGVEEDLRALEKASASLAPLERQIGKLEAEIAEAAAGLAEQDQAYQRAREGYEAEAADLPDLNRAEQDVFNLQSEENRLRMEVGMVRQSVAVLDTLRDRRARLSGQREGHSLQAARLKTLERAFSKDGVPALLIEQALPEIETQANEILDRLSNGAMSVRFATQRQYKDKNRDDRRETLDIIISDGAGEREYEMFSGGEAFRVNFAIRLALSRVLAQRAGARLQTLVIDEGFGSQDAEGRQRLIEAINLVRPEFAKILIITHLEELKEAFPARIEVEKTLQGSQVAVVT